MTPIGILLENLAQIFGMSEKVDMCWSQENWDLGRELQSQEKGEERKTIGEDFSRDGINTVMFKSNIAWVAGISEDSRCIEAVLIERMLKMTPFSEEKNRRLN